VARIQIRIYPARGSFGVWFQRCQSYLFFGLPSVTFCQLAPKSVDKSTCFTVRSPAQAAPRNASSLVPAAIFDPFAGEVTIERTGTDSRILKFFGSPLSPGIIGLIGTR